MAPNPLVQHSQTYASSKVNSGTVVHKPFLSVSMDSEDKFDSFMSLPQPQPPPSPSPHPPTTLSTHYTEASPVQAPITLPTHYTEGQGVHTQFLLESSSLEFTPLPMDVKNGAPLEHSIPTEENPELSILTLDSTQVSLTCSIYPIHILHCMTLSSSVLCSSAFITVVHIRMQSHLPSPFADSACILTTCL